MIFSGIYPEFRRYIAVFRRYILNFVDIMLFSEIYPEFRRYIAVFGDISRVSLMIFN
jgi:hypothetical protein